LIDLTAKSFAAGDIRLKVVGLTPRTPQVTDSGVVATSSTAANGKRMVHSIEKWLQIMESKLKKRKGQNGSIDFFFWHAFVFWNVMIGMWPVL